MNTRWLLALVPVALLPLAACVITTGQQPQTATPTAASATATATTPETPATATATAATPTTPGLKIHTSTNKEKEVKTPDPALGTPMTAANVFGSPTQSATALKGTVYWIESSNKVLPAIDALTPATTLYSETLNIPAKVFKEGFPGVDANRVEWFAIRYVGQFAVAAAGDYKLRLLSKDGSKVWIDSAPVVANDGIHPPQSKTETVKLAAGTHAIQVDYFQGAKGQVALQLFVTGPDGAEKPYSASF